MRRICLKLQYDGTAYNGWQVQPSGTSVQGLLQESIFQLTGENVAVIGAGRTDAGVHAMEQVAVFNSSTGLDVAVIKRALNALLPEDIMVMDALEVDQGFHPRYDAKAKRYSYLIANMGNVPVFVHRYLWWIRTPLDIGTMKTAAAYLLGTHDFSSFRGTGCGARHAVRTVTLLEIEQHDELSFLSLRLEGNLLRLSIEADGFLRHMVRNIVGTLAESGRGRFDPETVKDILTAKDRRRAGPTAPAQGLFLEKIIF